MKKENEQMNKLVIPTIKTFLLGVAILGLLLFLPAWRLNYWQGWLFIVAFMTSVSVIGVYLSLKDPELLERRKRVGPSAEQSPQQKIIMSLSILTLPALLIFCALDDRFGWSPVPGWVSILGAVMVVLGLMIDLV